MSASAPAPRSLAVLDIDGVLADVSSRLHHLQRRPKDWSAFFAGMADDPVLAPGFALAWQFADEHDIVYLTGRPAAFAGLTREWLRRHGFPDAPVVHRRDGDRRPASITKSALLRALMEHARVHVAVDDDETVCTAYRRLGVTVVHADWAPQSPVLHREQERGST
jgi:hypothetical protein